MEKKFRKELEQQISITLAYFVKKQDEKVAAGMAKAIRSASKDLAKKFVKERADFGDHAPEKVGDKYQTVPDVLSDGDQQIANVLDDAHEVVGNLRNDGENVAQYVHVAPP